MLTIRVEFLHSTYRADPDGSAITGQAERGEWPPSVARLLAAFVAADAMGEECRVTDGTELQLLESLGPPAIYAEASPSHQPLNSRFVVLAHKTSRKGSTHQEYPARKGAEVRPGVRVSLRHPDVVYVWEDAEPTDSFEALRLRAARIGYLGCADSPVRVRVSTKLDEVSAGDLHLFRPLGSGTCMVSVPRPGRHLEALKAAYDAWLEHGPKVSRSQFPALRNLVAYEGPEDVADPNEVGSVAAWLRFTKSVPGRRLADVTSALKAAVMSRYTRLYGEPLPQVLHGHGFKSSGYEIARYLALPNTGFEYSDGRIHGAAVWLPLAREDVVVDRARAAARSITELTAPNLRIRVAPWAGEQKPQTAHPARWQRKSKAWVTATPAIHERFGKLTLDELRRWCRHAGLPDPVRFRSARVPLVGGALRLQPEQVHRSQHDRAGDFKPYSHVEMHFDEAVRGPVVIGGGRSRGFGLCIPADTLPRAARPAVRTRPAPSTAQSNQGNVGGDEHDQQKPA